MSKKNIAAVNTAEFYGGLLILFLIVAVIMYFFPTVVPFGLFEFFKFNFSWSSLSGIPIILLLFGPVLNIVVKLFTKNGHSKNIETINGFDMNLWTSIKAGIFEEISYRWLVFYFMIISFTLRDIIFNWLISISWIAGIFALPWWAIACILLVLNFFGAIGYYLLTDKEIGCFFTIIGLIALVLAVVVDVVFGLGILKWWYVTVVMPLVNYITLGKMSAQLFGYSWMVGAAVVSSNWDFGQGHTYQGCIGWANSWIIGMLMFWITFNFGLIPAMMIHALYDIVIDFISYTDAKIELAIS